MGGDDDAGAERDVRRCGDRHAPRTRVGGGGATLARLDLTELPVVDGDRRLLGVIEGLDLIGSLRGGCDLRDATAHDLMRPSTLYVEPDTELEPAADLMLEHALHHLPVCRDGRLVGLLSHGDVLRALMTVCLQRR
jgi:CBS domain-containing protein